MQSYGRLKRMGIMSQDEYVENRITTKDNEEILFFTKESFTEKEIAWFEQFTKEEIGALLEREFYTSKHNVQ